MLNPEAPAFPVKRRASLAFMLLLAGAPCRAQAPDAASQAESERANLAALYSHLKRYDEAPALALYRAGSLLELDSSDQSREVLAEALLLGGGSDEAIRIARSLIGGPNEVDGHYVLALAARDAGDGATALSEFKKALKIYDDHHRAGNERRVCAHDMQADVRGEILKLRPGVPPEAR